MSWGELGGSGGLTRKKPAPEGAGSWVVEELLTWTDVGFVVLETQPLIGGVLGRGTKVADEYEGLEVISEAVELIGIASIVSLAFERISHFQLAVVLTSHGVRAKEGVVHPLAKFVRHCGNVL